jgi:hypothetical protein
MQHCTYQIHEKQYSHYLPIKLVQTAFMGEDLKISNVWYRLLNMLNVSILRRMRRGSELMALSFSHLVTLGIRHSCIPEYENLLGTRIDK